MATQETATDRLELVMGKEALLRIQSATVLVLGLGGVGSNCVVALARGGVGKLILLDRDSVSPSNINRQAVAYQSTIGRVKTEVMSDIVHDINPECKVTLKHCFLSADSTFKQLDELLAEAGTIDYVVDAIDTVSQKLLIAEWAQKRGIRLISSMGGANKINPERLRFAKIENTVSCPLCKVMRKECKKRNIKGLEVLYSSEVPLSVHKKDGTIESGQKRPEKGLSLGTMSYIPPIMGQMIAGHVICALADITNENDKHDPALDLKKQVKSRSKHGTKRKA